MHISTSSFSDQASYYRMGTVCNTLAACWSHLGYIMCGRPKALSRFPDHVQDLAVELFLVCCLHMLITLRPQVFQIRP